MSDGNSINVNGKTTTITSANSNSYYTLDFEVAMQKEHKEKLKAALSGNKQNQPTDDGLSTSTKTPEQEANLAKLTEAKKFMQSEEGEKLADTLLNQKGVISQGQKKWLKKQGIDADAFLQEWQKKNSSFDPQNSDEIKDNMGALANAHLGENTEELPQNRMERKNIKVINPEERTFLQKLFTKKEKQVVADSKKHSPIGGTRVNIHSSQTAQREANFLNDISENVAKEGNKYLESFNGGPEKRRTTYNIIDEDGNATKVKVIRKKDGSVKKVVTKSDEDGKLVVKRAKDGHITVKGDLQSDNIMVEAKQITAANRTVHKDSTKETTIIENCDEAVPQPKPTVKPKPKSKSNSKPVPVPPQPQPVPIVPSKPKPGGLIQDYVNAKHSSGIGWVQGRQIRDEFKEHGPSKMVNFYCSYTDDTAPDSIKARGSKTPGSVANRYNGLHLAEALINDAENKSPDINSLGELIKELKKQGKTDALMGVKSAILSHDRNLTTGKIYDEGTRTVNQPVSASKDPVVWLMENTKISQSFLERK